MTGQTDSVTFLPSDCKISAASESSPDSVSSEQDPSPAWRCLPCCLATAGGSAVYLPDKARPGQPTNQTTHSN